MTHGHHCRGHAQQVEPFGVAPRIQILHELPFNLPTALAVMEGGNCGGGTKQQRESLHLLENFYTHHVALHPHIQQRFSCMRRALGDPFQKLFQYRTHDFFMALSHRAKQHASRNAKELPPELAGFFQAFGTEWFHLKAGALQKFRGIADCGARFSRDRSASVIFEICDANIFHFLCAWPTHGNRRGGRITVIRPLHHLEKNFQVSGGPRHWPYYASQSKRSDGTGKMSRGGNAARGRLQSANSAEVRGHADGTSAIATNAARGTSRGNRRRLAST